MKEEEQFCRRCGEYISYGICYPCFDKAIKKAKKEVFEDTDEIINRILRWYNARDEKKEWIEEYEKIKKRHLSTFKKKGIE